MWWWDSFLNKFRGVKKARRPSPSMMENGYMSRGALWNAGIVDSPFYGETFTSTVESSISKYLPQIYDHQAPTIVDERVYVNHAEEPQGYNNGANW